MPSLKLTYFDFTGRAEAVRKVLTLGGIPFTDERVSYAQFQQLKPSFPYGKMPVLEVDGEVFAETQGLLRYAARLAGLYPPSNEPVAAMMVDEVLDTFEDFFDRLFQSSFDEKDPVKVKQMREATLAGPLPHALALIEQRLQQIQAYAFFQDNAACVFVHEIIVWDYVVTLRSGMLEHIPTTLVDSYKTIAAIHDKVIACKNGPKPQSLAKTPPQLPKHLKLTYFDVEARAQPIRLALHIGGIAFDDERISQEQMQTRKSEFPNEQVPVLTMDNTIVAAQSFALLRYAGRITELYPTDDLLVAVMIDEVIGHAHELDTVLYRCEHESDKEKQKLQFTTILEKTIPEFLGSLDKRIAQWTATGKTKAPFAVAARLTIADLAIYNLLHDLKSTIVDDVSAYTRLGEVYETVATHPRVVDWHNKVRK